ncbi:hypothetical protein DYB37_010171 [Aphanomyces astaci]|uniref:Uncharacterized protein n=1 Tax=Aphanomyces astaci TaxID=112090 RepID=A0A418EYA7_APHAT|nr:hypothetical protein DYB37_010171 [Aphanomyces astaci]
MDANHNELLQVLVKSNQEWLDVYASHAVAHDDCFVAHQRVWFNDYFQKLRVLTDPSSRQGTESFLREVCQFMAFPSIVARSNEAGCVLSTFSDRVLTTLSSILPMMFISTLAKRYPGCNALDDLTTQLIAAFDVRKRSLFLDLSYAPPNPSPVKTPKKSPVLLSSLSSPSFKPPTAHLRDKSPFLPQPKSAFGLRSTTSIPCPSPKHSPSADKPNKLVPPDSPARSRKLLPVSLAPLDQIEQRLHAFNLAPPQSGARQDIPNKTCELALPLIHHPGSGVALPITAPPPRKSLRHTSHGLTSASGFEWWWRTLPSSHTSLAPHAKLKAVCVAAIKMHSTGVYDRAVELYTLALSLALPVPPVALHVRPTPDDGDVEPVSLSLKLQLNLGSAAFSLGHIGDSIRAFESAIRMQPQHKWAHYKLGMAYQADGRVEIAVAEWRAIAKLFPLAQAELDAVERGNAVSQTELHTKTVKAKNGDTESPEASRGGASKESKTAKQRLKDVVRHLAGMGVRMGIHFPQLFSRVDRYRLGVVTTVTFKEILRVSGLTLTSQEYADLARYLRDPNDPRYLSYAKLLADATFVAVASASDPPVVSLDQMCFHGARKRTPMEKLCVPLHLIAQSECHQFFSTMASWASFGVSKAIAGGVILHASWLRRLTYIPAAPPSVVSTEAGVFVRNAIASGSLQAKHLILVRRRVAKKLSLSLVAQAQYTACVHMCRWRNDGVHNVSVAMGRHVLDCAVAKILLTTRAQRARGHMERQSAVHADCRYQGQRSTATVDRRRQVNIALDDVACRARASIVWKRKARTELARVATKATTWTQSQVVAKVALVGVVTTANKWMDSMQQSRLRLAEYVQDARVTLDNLRILAWEQLVDSTRLVVAQTTVSTILVTMVQTVAARGRVIDEAGGKTRDEGGFGANSPAPQLPPCVDTDETGLEATDDGR